MNRYSRQIIFKDIGESGQNRLQNSRICIVGIGALGTVAAELLTRAGIGELTLIDRDFIELNNLQRQTLFSESDVGKSKSETAKEILKKINSDIKINAITDDLDYRNIPKSIKNPDLILGCTDNMESRFLINDYALKNNIRWIHGAAVADKSYLFNIIPQKACLRCIFKGAVNETCDAVGILNSNSSIIASIMANEAIKILLNIDCEKSLLHLDLSKNDLMKINVKKNPKCLACIGNYEYLNGEKHSASVKLCGSGSYQIKGNKVNLDEVEDNLKKLGKATRFSKILHFDNITIFENGRAIIKANSEKEARSLYSKYIGN